MLLNSALFTAQRRKRLFWCGHFALQPSLLQDISERTECSETVRDILDDDREQCVSLTHPRERIAYLMDDTVKVKGHKPGLRRIDMFPYYNDTRQHKTRCLGAFLGTATYNVVLDHRFIKLDEEDGLQPLIRQWTVREVERLQGFPPGHVDDDVRDRVLSYRQAMRALGNAVTVPAVAALLESLRQHMEATNGWTEEDHPT